MSAPGDREARVKLATMREFKKADGTVYLRGWLGDCVVLGFRNDRVEPEYGSIGTWDLFVVPKKPKVADGAQAPSARRQTGRRESWQAPARTRWEPTSHDVPNDDLPF